MVRTWCCAVLLICGALAAPPAQATVLIYMNTKQLTEKSTAVVRGTVVRQQVVEVKGHLWTDSYIRISEAIKGKVGTGQEMVLRQPGGETATLGERVVGAASFSIGEEVLVFARPVRHFYVPVGMCLGKYRIQRGTDGVVDATRDLATASLAVFEPNGRFRVLPPRSSAADRRQLADLRQEIARAVKGGVR